MATILLLVLGCSRSAVPCVPNTPPPEAPRAAGCIVVSNGGLLMVRTAGGWSIPGGGVEPGESTAETAARETLEESGVTVTSRDVACVARDTAFVAHRCDAVAAGAPTPDGWEAYEARYVSAEELASWPEDAFRFPAQVETYRAALRP